MTRRQIAALAYTRGFEAAQRELLRTGAALMAGQAGQASLIVRPRWRVAFERSYRAGVRGAQRSFAELAAAS